MDPKIEAKQWPRSTHAKCNSNSYSLNYDWSPVLLLRDAKNRAYLSLETEEDVECLVKDTERQPLLDEIADEVGARTEASITFDVYDLCEYYHQDKLSAFNVQMLTNILSHLEVPFKSKIRRVF